MTGNFVKNGMLVLLCAASPAAAAVKAAPPKLGLYCTSMNKPQLQVFADKLLPNGDLAFGMEIYEANGHTISLFGVASRQKNGWEYLSDVNEADVADRCKVRIVSAPDGTPILTGDSVMRCRTKGGVGTEVGTRHFALRHYKGPVRTELADPDSFFNQNPRCS